MPCSPGMRACSIRCLHKQFVLEYRDARAADERALDDAAGYETERREYLEAQPLITFKKWLNDRSARQDPR